MAANIAKNGLRIPLSILDSDGTTLLDGNRRVTACHYLLRHADFSAEQKKLVEEITVWQLTEHADEDDREEVIVARTSRTIARCSGPTTSAQRSSSSSDMLCMRAGQQNLDDKKELAIRKDLAKKFALKGRRPVAPEHDALGTEVRDLPH